MMSHCLNKHLTIFSLLTFCRPLFLSFPLYLISLVLFHPGQTHPRSLSPIAVVFIPLNVWGKQQLLLGPCTSSGERVRGVSGPAQNVPHSVLLISLGVLGRELLPAAPLQPCAGAPSGRGHTIFWTVFTWPQDIMQHRCPPCNTGMRHPLGMAPCAEAPHPVGYPVGGFYPSLASTFPAQFLPPTLLSVTFSFIARLNIK